MSYDLMVFDREAGPADRSELEEWFQAKMEEIESISIQDPKATTPPLRAWYADMIAEFPDYNADGAADDIGNNATGYTCCPTAVYMDFRWSVAEAAYHRTMELAARHHLGFFDVSGTNGDLWTPDGEGRLLLRFSLKS